MNSNRAIYGEQQDDACIICNSRHFQNSRQNRICTATEEMWAALASPANVEDHAREARRDGDAHYARYQRTGSDFRLEQARQAYAKAYAWETGVGAAELLGADVAQAMTLVAKGLI